MMTRKILSSPIVCRMCFCIIILVAVIYLYITMAGWTPGQPEVLKANTDNALQMQVPQMKNFSIIVDDAIAKVLERQIRVLCWIAMTDDTMDRASVVMETWGRRCTKIILIGDKTTKNMTGVVSLEVDKGRDHLWPKSREAFRYVYENHFDDADWFLKADTDTYVIMENLRLLLSQQDVTKPVYLGCPIQLYVKQGYNSGGAGYLINKEAMKKLIGGIENQTCFKGVSTNEDISFGDCMQQLGVNWTDPTDGKGKNRFFPFEPADHINHASPGANIWYWDATFKPGSKSMDCCSETVISFHYVSKQLMWNMEFLLYHAKVFGVSTTFNIP